MAKSPGFTFYPKDFIADTQLLSPEEVGAYWLLCCSAWVGLPGYEQGFLPAEDEKLATLARLTPERWRSIGTPIRALFQEDGEGRLFHKRLLEELRHQQARSGVARASALRRYELHGQGGTPPAAGTPATASPEAVRTQVPSQVRMQMPAQSERTAARQTQTKSQSQTESHSKSEDGGPGEGSAAAAGAGLPVDELAELRDFERFWTAYPRRSKKAATLAAWRATRAVRPPIDELLERLAVLADSVEWNRDSGRYRPTSLTFVEGHRWEDSSTPRRSPAAAAAGPELDDFDLPGRLARLAAAVRGVVARGPELALEILAAAKEGPADLVEQRLDAIDRELLAAAELELSREERAEVDRVAIEAARRAPGAATAHQVDDVAARLRPQVLRRERRLPRLTLFGAEAEGRERGAA